MDEILKSIADKAAAALPGLKTRFAFGELTLHCEAGAILEALTFLRDDPDCQFVCFTDITAADYPRREKRFDLVYQLLSPRKNARVRVEKRDRYSLPNCAWASCTSLSNGSP